MLPLLNGQKRLCKEGSYFCMATIPQKNYEMKVSYFSKDKANLDTMLSLLEPSTDEGPY